MSRVPPLSSLERLKLCFLRPDDTKVPRVEYSHVGQDAGVIQSVPAPASMAAPEFYYQHVSPYCLSCHLAFISQATSHVILMGMACCMAGALAALNKLVLLQAAHAYQYDPYYRSLMYNPAMVRTTFLL